MDSNRFDNISRAIAARTTRRDAIRQVGASGMLAAAAGALGINRLSASAQDDDDDTSDADVCTLYFYAETAIGPNKSEIYEGEIDLEIGDDGEIDAGLLRTNDGDEYELVGQATGRAIDLRITLKKGRYLTLTGTAQRDVDRCRGDMEGTFGGPQRGDLGTWIASKKPITDGVVDDDATVTPTTGSGSGGDNSGGSDEPPSTPTPCPEIDCGSTFVLNPETCECECPYPYLKCGESTCCFGGSVCYDDGSCSCPEGMEACNEICTPSCPSGQYFDSNCECYAETSCGEGETLCNGACVSLSCPSNQLFDQSACMCVNRCGSGEDYCGGVCIDVINDESNCGYCDNTCPANMPCIAGTCKCPGGQSYVDGVCK